MKCSECGKRMKKKIEDYEYKESGLDGVILSKIPVYHCDCGEYCASIANIYQVHQEMADKIVARRDRPLSNREIMFIRKFMRKHLRGFGQMLGVTPRTVLRWELAQRTPTKQTDLLIRYTYLLFQEGVLN